MQRYHHPSTSLTPYHSAGDGSALKLHIAGISTQHNFAKSKFGYSYEKRLFIGFFVGWLVPDVQFGRTFNR